MYCLLQLFALNNTPNHALKLKRTPNMYSKYLKPLKKTHYTSFNDKLFKSSILKMALNSHLEFDMTST